jgi:arabinose-5-phosphate isomerase
MRATLAVLAAEPAPRKLAVLGEMGELGADSAAYHAELAPPVIAAGVDVAILVGAGMKPLAIALEGQVEFVHVPDAEAALAHLKTVLSAGDAVLMISKSGDTTELKQLVPLLQSMGEASKGIPIIALVGNTDSYLARNAAAVLDASVEQEACPNNLAPTTSTTVAMALGDALAVCLMDLRGFTDADFARYHPGGSLGKRLYLRVLDLAHLQPPSVPPTASLREVIVAITQGRLGAVLVLQDEKLAGIITDGDLRRLLERTLPTGWDELSTRTAGELASTQPKTISASTLAIQALEQMQRNGVTQLVVMEGDRPLGLIHLHDLLREGF